jgi:transcriptional regulator of aromatic amino acid metabolism
VGLQPRRKVLSLEVPVLRDQRKQRALENLVRQFVERVAELIE